MQIIPPPAGPDVLTVVSVCPAIVHPKQAVSSQNGEGVVDDGAELGVDIFGYILPGTGSVPGPVDKVAHHFFVAFCQEEDVLLVSSSGKVLVGLVMS